ncbi:hypothetical protein UY3_12032 [Chelonia mydas]|uniref:Uncharacterized protein n=1 Tax=Chelonia mydas TaxID=8469 RepID=M7BRV3_CHEMY|nr:hypothetical protein UY3_12032 [Chelonia mydas]
MPPKDTTKKKDAGKSMKKDEDPVNNSGGKAKKRSGPKGKVCERTALLADARGSELGASRAKAQFSTARANSSVPHRESCDAPRVDTRERDRSLMEEEGCKAEPAGEEEDPIMEIQTGGANSGAMSNDIPDTREEKQDPLMMPLTPNGRTAMV